MRYDGRGVVMMQSRGEGDEIRASTFQYHPAHLVYRVGSEWHGGDLYSVHRRMVQAAPEDVRPGLRVLWRGEARQSEDVALVAVRWIERCGDALGFRAPRATERARATGRGDYLVALGLPERGLYDLVGDHFDPDALLVRILGPIRAWARGEAAAAPDPLEPRELMRIYARVRNEVVRSGCQAAAGPFPDDLRGPLMGAPPPHAARGGRADQ